MVEPAFLALTTTPSMAPSRSDAILPLSAVSGDCAAAVPAAINSQASKPVPQTRAPIVDPRIWILPDGSCVAPGSGSGLSSGRPCAESISSHFAPKSVPADLGTVDLGPVKVPISGNPETGLER